MQSTSLAAARRAIVALVHAYPRLQDTADFEGIGKLFAKGRFSSTMGHSLGGAELAADRARGIRLHEDGTPRTSIPHHQPADRHRRRSRRRPRPLLLRDAQAASRRAAVRRRRGPLLRRLRCARTAIGVSRSASASSISRVTSAASCEPRAEVGSPRLALRGPSADELAATPPATGRGGRDRGADLHLRRAHRPRGFSRASGRCSRHGPFIGESAEGEDYALSGEALAKGLQGRDPPLRGQTRARST